MKDDFYKVEGLPQRRKMCEDCPGRPGSRGSVDSHLRRFAAPSHRCHSALGSVCAAALAQTEEGMQTLFIQLEREACS